MMRRFGSGAAAAAVSVALMVAFSTAPGTAEAATSPTTFSFTGTTQSYVVPAGTTAITISAFGAQGGNGGTCAATQPVCGTPGVGGLGAQVTSIIPVTPGETLTVVVGGRGNDGATTMLPGTACFETLVVTVGGSGGFGGGGDGGDGGCPAGASGGGGGATAILRDSTVLVVRGGRRRRQRLLHRVGSGRRQTRRGQRWRKRDRRRHQRGDIATASFLPRRGWRRGHERDRRVRRHRRNRLRRGDPPPPLEPCRGIGVDGNTGSDGTLGAGGEGADGGNDDNVIGSGGGGGGGGLFGGGGGGSGGASLQWRRRSRRRWRRRLQRGDHGDRRRQRGQRQPDHRPIPPHVASSAHRTSDRGQHQGTLHRLTTGRLDDGSLRPPSILAPGAESQEVGPSVRLGASAHSSSEPADTRRHQDLLAETETDAGYRRVVASGIGVASPASGGNFHPAFDLCICR